MNVPNALTTLRLLFVPAFMFLYLKGADGDIRYGVWIAAGIFVLAAITDILDGYIARKFNQITDFGKLADPLADKLMQIAAVGCLAYNGRFAAWIFYIFVVKEVLMIFGGVEILKKHKFVVYSKWSGKIATVVLFIMIVIIMVFEHIPKRTATVMMVLCVVFSLLALFNYFQMYLNIKEERKRKKTGK